MAVTCLLVGLLDNCPTVHKKKESDFKRKITSEEKIAPRIPLYDLTHLQP